MYPQTYSTHKSVSPHPDYSHLAYPPPHPSQNSVSPHLTLHPPHAYHEHHPGASNDLTSYSFPQTGSQRNNFSPHEHISSGSYGRHDASSSSVPQIFHPIETVPSTSHVRAVHYSPQSKEPSSMMLEYASGLQMNPATQNAYYTSTFNTSGPSSQDFTHGQPPQPASSSLLHSLNYSPTPHLSAPTSHHETKTRSAYKVVEPTGRRKSETSTSQARRNSSTNNPYSRSRKETAASQSTKAISTRKYDTLSVLSNELGPIGPTNHILVPQDTVFGEPTSYDRYQEHLFQPISFRAEGFHELGVKLTQVLKQRADPIDGGEDRVFQNSAYREIKIKIQWPGYPHHPFERRMKTHNCTITRATVCLVLANMVLDFVMMLKDRKVQVEKGYEGWAIGKGGFKANEFWITGLLHRGGNSFQPEIWVPQ